MPFVTPLLTPVCAIVCVVVIPRVGDGVGAAVPAVGDGVGAAVRTVLTVGDGFGAAGVGAGVTAVVVGGFDFDVVDDVVNASLSDSPWDRPTYACTGTKKKRKHSLTISAVCVEDVDVVCKQVNNKSKNKTKHAPLQMLFANS
jgi:hypothetical protein